ncbi:MAG: hypothetical protein A2036_04145 [Omnitrophica bacterium GWA2_50_21]|nr:MAG: hypothetical protein A2036_04145 [Omnitrophica bacterium GWA2_50_21]
MKTSRSLLAMILLLSKALILPANTLAEVIEGKIVLTDASTQNISIKQEHPMAGKPDPVYLSITSETRFTGISDFSQLKPGDQVRAQASQKDASGNLQAAAIEKT